MKNNEKTPGNYQQYQEQLDRVVNHIYSNLEGELRIEALADVACLSPYHWHRIYTAMRGETVAETVKRLRMARAADRLANSDLAILDIAKRAGYTRIESFNRAFKGIYKFPPNAYRNRGEHSKFKQASAQNNAAIFPVSIEDKLKLKAVGIPHKGNYMEIDRAMARLFQEVQQQNLLNGSSSMFAVFLDDPDLVHVDELRSYACLTYDGAVVENETLKNIDIRSGMYAKLEYTGPYANMKEAYRWLYGTWLPNSNYLADNAPCLEMYLNNPQVVAPSELRTDIYLPVVCHD